MAGERLIPIGTTLSAGRYAIAAKLGEGGMGAVYRARDNNIAADVVIKVPHRSMVTDPEFSRRFRDEIRSLVRLSHPHIVKVTDVGEWDGIPFAVLQFLPGGSLEDRRSTWRGPLALVELEDWLEPVARALDYVHSQRMVHRDVKPANILFDEQGHGFLGDFGVVKVLAAVDDRTKASMTGAGMVLGTPHYMAPELIMGDPFDGRVDQYALAVTVYELLCGRRPFEHDVPTRVLMMQTRDEPPSAAALAPWLPGGLEEALLIGLAKDPAERYASCAAMATAVIEATGIRRGDPSPRARIRCGACGQTIKVAVDSLIKLCRKGRTAPCPHCKLDLNLAAGAASAFPPAPSNKPATVPTQVLDVRGSSAEMAAARPGGSGTVAIEPTPPSRTVAIDTGRAAKTVALPRPDDDGDGTLAIDFTRGGKTVVLPSQIGTRTVAIDTGRAAKTVAIDTGRGAVPPVLPETGGTSAPWLPLALAAAASALIVGGGVFWMTSGGAPKPVGSAALASAEGRAPQAGLPKVVPIPPAGPAALDVTTPAAVNLSSDSASIPPPTVGSTAAPASSGRAEQAPPLPPPLPSPSLVASRSPLRPAMPTNQPAPGAAPAGSVESLGNRPGPVDSPKADLDSVVPDDAQPDRRNVPLKTLMDDPESFAGMLITLDETYALNRNPWRMPDGSLQVGILRSDLEISPQMRIREGAEFSIGLDRQLADRLVQLKKMNPPTPQKSSADEWNLRQPATLHVKVAARPGRGGGPPARIVRVELFQSFSTAKPRKILQVVLRTERISQSSSKTQEGDDDEWRRPARFGHAYRQFTAFRDGIKRSRNMQAGAALDAYVGQSMAAAAAQFAAGQGAALSRMRNSLGPQR